MCRMTTKASDSYPDEEHERDRKISRWLLAGGAALGVALLVVGIAVSEQKADVGLEVAKVGLQVLAVGIVGGALAFAWRVEEKRRDERKKRIEQAREERLAIHDRQLAMFLQVVSAYNGVKALRRSLKSLGLKSGEAPLTAWQADGFHEQMGRLNELQLVFEAMVRELGETDLFDSDTAAIVRELSAIEKYLNDVLACWEERGANVRDGSPRAHVASELKDLLDARLFKCGIVSRRRRLTEIMHKRLFGLVSADKLERLAQLEARDDR